jgi:23S rRNA pseudouridine1911/1915/1917 synthase
MNLISKKEYKFIATSTQKKERIDVYLTKRIENATRTKIQKLIDSGYVLVNKSQIKTNYKVRPNDEIYVEIPIKPRPGKALPEPIEIDIVYEDEFLLVVNKPAGITVHPALGIYSGTLVNALLYHTQKLSSLNDESRPGIVHRIDKDTTGLLVVAKDEYAHAHLAAQFAKKKIEREYWLICWGLLKNKKGRIENYIGRSKSDRKKFAVVEDGSGKLAVTNYEVIEEFEFASLVKANLETGRTHQIRTHFAHINHPIFGDPTYGGRRINYGGALHKLKSRVENLLEIMKRQALHAKTLGFIHPYKKEWMRFDSALPEDFKLLLSKLRGE